MPEGWSRQAADFVDATTVCPRCGTALAPGPACPRCRARLDGAEGAAVREASVRAAEALRERQRLIDLLPTGTTVAAPAPLPFPAPDAAAGPPSAQRPSAQRRPRSQLSVSSVLAVVGAALVAIAAIVFAFLNPDIGFAARTTIVAVLTAAFLGAAWLMMRRGLRLSAEAVGALGMVLVVLDVEAAVQRTPLGLSGWVPAAVGALLASVVMLAAAVRVRLRVWLWTSLLGFVLVPAMLGYAVAPVTDWAVHLGHLAAGFVAWGVQRMLRRLEGRFASPLRADHVTATALALVASGLVAVRLPFSPAPSGFAMLDETSADGALPRLLLSAAVLAGLAALAVLAARDRLSGLWSALAGIWIALAVAQFALVPLPDDGDLGLRVVTLLAAAGAVTAVGLVAVRTPAWITRPALLAGGVTVAGLLVIPAAGVGLFAIASTGLALPSAPELDAVGGLAIAAAGAAAAGIVLRRRGQKMAARAAVIAGLWLAVAAIASAAMWIGWDRATSAVLAVVIAAALGLALLLVPRLRVAGTGIRIPVLVGGQLLLLLAVLVSWQRDALTVPIGAAAVAALVPLTLVLPRAARPYALGAGYAYALAVLATGLARAGVETIAVLCLTASAAALAGLVATLVTRLRAALWYAVLVVTAVPFLVAVASVIGVRSGWTALSTGLMLLLALTLLLTRRAGLAIVVRALAAGLVVPALAVVVVCLGAQLLATSGSPVVLPVIAVLVAGALSASAVVASGLRRRRMAEPEVAAARIALEASSLLTGAIAVLLALVRAAAGLPTTLVVLLILGAGAASAAVFATRRYGWWVAGVCGSGALWCALSLAGVQLVEPYVLPPALVLAVVGAVLSARGAAGLPLVATGLAAAVLPSLVLLAATGPGDGAVLPWRTLGLLAGALVLLVLSWVATGRWDRRGGLTGLHLPVLMTAIGAAAAGPIQGLRWGAGADRLDLPAGVLILPDLVVTLAGVVVAGLAARRIATRPIPAGALAGARFRAGGPLSRWLLVPALAYLVIGPAAAIRDVWLPIWTLWALLLVLLAGVVLIAWRARRGPTALPPVWTVWAAAWIVAVVGWSARELRVEVYSLPLAIALLLAGMIAMRPAPEGAPAVRPTPTTWPIGFSGSWALLAPGIGVGFLPSLLSTGTDPQTWRAVLVIALALAAILAGSLLKLAAPFVLGIAVLPIENVIVFAAQFGRAIGSTPWWITLASAGAVLLVIAATWERRTGRDRSVAARLRDLR